MIITDSCYYLPLLDTDGNYQVICTHRVKEIATMARTRLPPWARDVFPAVHAHMPWMDTEAVPVELLIGLEEHTVVANSPERFSEPGGRHAADEICLPTPIHDHGRMGNRSLP